MIWYFVNKFNFLFNLITLISFILKLYFSVFLLMLDLIIFFSSTSFSKNPKKYKITRIIEKEASTARTINKYFI